MLDTNAALDLWAFGDARVATLRQDLAEGAVEALGCPAMRRELALVLARGVGAGHGARIEEVLAAWDRAVRVVEDPPESPRSAGLISRDEDDQVFVDLAFHHQASFLLTSDRDLLSLRRRAARSGLTIERPQAWNEKAAGPEGHGG